MEERNGHESKAESQDIMELMLGLKSRFRKEDFERAAMLLISREEALKSEKSKLKIELERSSGKSALLEAENSSLKNQISGLSGKIRQTDKKLAELEKRLKRKADSSERFTKSSSNSRGYSSGNREISETSLTKGSERNCSKKTEFNWENEDDMLNSLVEDQYLCMEAVCVLFRLENSQVELGTKRPQGPKHRGLFGTDVLRASKMAYFLTRGDPSRPVQRTIEELNEFDEFGMQSCHQLIRLYSRHLFEVYKNKEDPYFGYNA